MLDYRKWIERAVAFVNNLQTLSGEVGQELRVDPPMSSLDVKELSGRLRLGIPHPVSNFLMEGSANCVFNYWWSPPKKISFLVERIFHSRHSSLYGGACLCASEDFEYNQTGCFDQSEALGARESDCWINSFPILSINNGDYVGMYVKNNRTTSECPIIYLDHDDYGTGTILSTSFDDFLLNWEDCCYIVPTWMSKFCDFAGGPLTERRELLKQLFRQARTNM